MNAGQQSPLAPGRLAVQPRAQDRAVFFQFQQQRFLFAVHRDPRIVLEHRPETLQPAEQNLLRLGRAIDGTPAALGMDDAVLPGQIHRATAVQAAASSSVTKPSQLNASCTSSLDLRLRPGFSRTQLDGGRIESAKIVRHLRIDRASAQDRLRAALLQRRIVEERVTFGIQNPARMPTARSCRPPRARSIHRAGPCSTSIKPSISVASVRQSSMV